MFPTDLVSDQVAYWQSSGMFAFSLALDSRNMPHVASVYCGNVDYSSFNGSEWSVESVPEIYMPSGDYISIKVDPNDVVHMACANYSEFTGNQSLRYAVRSNTGIWTHKTIVETGAAASELLLDSQNKPYIAAVLYDPWQANVYKLDSEGNWTPFCPIPEELATDSKVILTLDSNGYPRIPYMSSLDSGFAIRYGQWTGMEWLSSDIVADPQYNSVAFSVGFAPSGKPVVGFIPWNFGYDHVDNFSYATLE